MAQDFYFSALSKFKSLPTKQCMTLFGGTLINIHAYSYSHAYSHTHTHTHAHHRAFLKVRAVEMSVCLVELQHWLCGKMSCGEWGRTQYCDRWNTIVGLDSVIRTSLRWKRLTLNVVSHLEDNTNTSIAMSELMTAGAPDATAMIWTLMPERW